MQKNVIIDLRSNDYNLIGFGYYSSVFKDTKNNKAVKIFKNIETDKFIKFDDDINIYTGIDIRRKVYENEVAAYEEINNSQTDLIKYTPKYYGKIEISSILNTDGSDISNKYVLELNYVMDFISGNFEKWSTVNIDAHKKQEIIKQFNLLKIKYFTDSSVFIGNDAIKIIDFAKSKYEITDRKEDL